MEYTFVFDLDGTITKKELLPIIARELGIEEKIAILTRKTMDGEIPFDQSFTKRVNILKNVPISKVQKIAEKVPLSESIVDFLRQNRKRCYVVTQNLDVWIKNLMKIIDVPYLSSEANYKGNKLIGIKKILRKKEIHDKVKNPLVVIGDGYNDEEMMIDAKISIAYGGVHPPVSSLLEISDYAIYSDQQLCQFLKQLL